MNKLECFVEYKIINYMKNYCQSLLVSDRSTSILTFEKILDISKWVIDVNTAPTEGFVVFKSTHEKIVLTFDQYLESVDLSLRDEEIDFNGRRNDSGFRMSAREREKRLKKIERRIDGELGDQKLISSLLNELTMNYTAYLSTMGGHVQEKFKEIYELFQLDEVEKELLTIVYVAEVSSPFNNHIFCSDSDVLRRSSMKPQISFKYETKYASKSEEAIHRRIGFCLDIPSGVVKDNFKDESRLFELSLLENEDNPNLTDFVTDYIEGVSQNHFLNNIFEEVDLSKCFDIESSQINSKDKIILEQILNVSGGISILLKGKPGTGKTELVKSIANKLGVPLFNLKHSRKKKNEKVPPRKMALYLIQQLYANSNAIFLVDECEDLINTMPSFRFFRGRNDDENSKSFINEYLDENKCKFFFVANNTEEVDESTMRRFNYILTFNSISNEHRHLMIKSLFEKESECFLNEEEVKALAFRSKLNIGHFGIALGTVKRLNLDPSEKKNIFIDLVNNHSNEFAKAGINLKQINEKYSLDGLNCDHNLNEVTQKIIKCQQRIKESNSDTNLNVIFNGPPGTGKTEYAKYLASQLGLAFIYKQASDLKSKWVGETEKNIKSAFLEAQNTNSILFIDEIDAFLHPRDNASASWQISEVNEFLTCMENFKGIFICATNSTERMDSASLRRFLFKIKFDYLNSEGCVKFYKTFFQEFFDDELESALDFEIKTIKCLTPSDFNSVKRKLLLEEKITHESIILLLKQEVAYKKFHSRGSIGLSTV